MNLEKGQWTQVRRRARNDLPPEVLGTAQYIGSRSQPANNGYIVQHKTNQLPVEFINDDWYLLKFENRQFFTCPENKVLQDNVLGLGYWTTTDPRHPDNRKTVTTESTPVPSTSRVVEPIEEEYHKPAVQEEVDIISAGLHHTTTLQGTNHLNTEPIRPIIMTNIKQTTRMGGYVPAEEPPAAAVYTTSVEEPREPSIPEEKEQSLQGNKPKEFDGSRKDSETFMDHFNVYWRINRRNRNMKEPYTRVLMAISFMNGPKVQDWTRAQVKKLDYAVETLGEDPQSESLWRNF